MATANTPSLKASNRVLFIVVRPLQMAVTVGTVVGFDQRSTERSLVRDATETNRCHPGSMHTRSRKPLPVIGPGEASPRRTALVAQDNKKRDLPDWAHVNRDILAEHQLFPTATTAGLFASDLAIP